jgi:hypothetical protein
MSPTSHFLLVIFLALSLFALFQPVLVAAEMDEDSTIAPSNRAARFNSALKETQTQLYFILGNSTHRSDLVHKFIEDMQLDPKYVTITHAVDRSHIPVSTFGDFVEAGWVKHFYWKGYISDHRNKMAQHHHHSSLAGRWALQLSVIRAMEMFARSDYQNMVIFEDDVTIAGGLSVEKVHEVAETMIRLPADQWDLQYLGWCWECAELHERTFASDASQYHINAVFPLCRHSILYSRKAVQWYLKVWRPVYFLGGDEQLIRRVCEYSLKKIRPLQPLFAQSNSLAFKDSHLGNTDEKSTFFKWTDCKAWRSMCVVNKTASLEYNQLGRTPPDDLHTIDNILKKIHCGL